MLHGPAASFVTGLVLSALLAGAGPTAAAAAERITVEDIRAMLPESAEWDAWLAATGEEPPDFAAMPSIALPPDPLGHDVDGSPMAITTAAAWEAHRPRLQQAVMHWLIGTQPPPPIVTAEVLSETRGNGATSRQVRLSFDPGAGAELGLEVMIPDGDGPFPVFMVQHNHRGWGLIALRRGYLVCVYNGSDSNDDTASFIDAYPEHDWSKLLRRAWAASRCIDYLETVPEADTARIALTGHSRNGKLALMAAALDERIAAVISSSSGAGGCLTTREFSEQHFAEGIELITRRFPDWFHPRLRFFVGREDKLPVDFHHLVALAAPRPCLLSVAYHDGVESTWAIERTVGDVLPVYALYGAEANLAIRYRAMGHETSPVEIEGFLDWCDAQFGRGGHFTPDAFIHPHDWDAWASHQPDAIDPSGLPARTVATAAALADGTPITNAAQVAEKRAEVAAAMGAFLGEAPGLEGPEDTYGRDPIYWEQLLNRGSAGSGLSKKDLVFGEFINAEVYFPSNRDESERLPGVLWIHPVSNSKGYAAGYMRGEQPFRTLARAGVALFAYDQIGHGRRIEEVRHFYDRYPGWTLQGKMLRDAQAAFETLRSQDIVDPDRVFVIGYGTGALTALQLAALEPGVAGVAYVAGPPPFLIDDAAQGTGGLARWSHRHMLLPALGHFIGHEAHLPFDIADLLAAVAPRPALVFAPQVDREARPHQMAALVDALAPVYEALGAPDALRLATPPGYNHFASDHQALVVHWLQAVAGIDQP